jgi:alpha-beta hydrolase superfamily lysophospholipase
MTCSIMTRIIDVEDRNSTRKVMLVGHSVGGVVAKAAALLSNHPSCAVRDIIQLSSPNVRYTATRVTIPCIACIASR